MRLNTLTLKKYRSIDNKQIVEPFDNINVFIGINNAGKSHIVKAITNCSAYLMSKDDFTSEDQFNEDSAGQTEVSYSFPLDFDFIASLIDREELQRIPKSENLRYAFEKTNKDLLKEFGPFTLTITKVGNEIESDIDSIKTKFAKIIRDWGKTGGPVPGNVSESLINIPRITEHYIRLSAREGGFIRYIPDKRSISRITADAVLPDGTGLIQQLHKLRNSDDIEDVRRFNRIGEYARRLFNDDQIELMPYIGESNDELKLNLLLRNKDIMREISNFGYGYSELIIMATYIANIQNSIVIIEEPEVHLHPQLVKDFMEFIATDDNNNQFFITTHSNALLDIAIPKRKVFRVYLENGATRIEPLKTEENIYDTLMELGVKPSDIMQSNYVIWVEGPSDRIYIKKWIELLVEKESFSPIEGLEYSFEYYGGRLLSHYKLVDAAIEDEVEGSIDELINILRITRNCSVVIDSDKNKAEDDISENKQRIQEECKVLKRHCWITGGREIENYISDKVLKEALGIEGLNQYGKIDSLGDEGKKYSKQKVLSSKKAVSYMTYKSEFGKPKLDLRNMVEGIIDDIKKYNGNR